MPNKQTHETTADASPVLQKGHGFVHLPKQPAGNGLTGNVRSGLPAVFLDRDGVINQEVGFIRDSSGLRILPGVAEALRSLAPRFRLVVITNQSGIARGFYSEEDLLAVNQELARQLAGQGASIEAFYYCPHLPEGNVPAYSVECPCRKPKPGMLRQAAEEFGIPLGRSYMVGDTPRDVQAAAAAGVAGILIGETAAGCPEGVTAVASLLDAAELILKDLALTTEPGIDDARMSVEPITAAAQRGEVA